MLRSVREVAIEPGEFPLLNPIQLYFITENEMINCIKGLFLDLQITYRLSDLNPALCANNQYF